MMTVVEDCYLEWNRVIAGCVFTPESDGQPVYLDMDDDMLARIAAAAGVEPSHVESRLTEAVAGQLRRDIEGHHRLFAAFDRLLARWSMQSTRRPAEFSAADRDSPPPVIALLTVFVLAAEHMGRSPDNPVGAHAYYPKLLPLLGLSRDDLPRMTAAFRYSAPAYWEALSEWLNRLDGRYGLPSAVAYGHRHIGLPVSQALVRNAERQRIRQMFGDVGMVARQVMAPSEMVLVLGRWIDGGQGANTVLKRLWATKELRERIAEVACVELAAWDGNVREHGTPRRGTGLRLAAWCSGIRSELRLAVTAPGASADGITWEADTPSGPASVRCVELSPSLIGVTSSESGLSPTAILESPVRVKDPSGHLMTRTPVPTILFAFDELSEHYVEVERGSTEQLHWLLVRTSSGDLESRTDDLLTAVASGWNKRQGRGVPPGWTLYTGIILDKRVHSMDPNKVHSSLRDLIPASPERIVLDGGLRLPGRLERYSAHLPPTVSVQALPGSSARLSIQDLSQVERAEVGEETMASLTGTAQCPSALLPGDFLLRIVENDHDGVETLVTTRTLRLRSSASPDQGCQGALGHFGLIGAVQAEDRPDDVPAFRGAMSRGPEDFVLSEPPADITWSIGSPAPEGRVIELAPATEMSCLWSGWHHVDVESSGDGRWQVQRYTCCGRTKHTPVTPRTIKGASGLLGPLVSKARGSVTPSRDCDIERALRDAMIYVGSGSQSDLAQLAARLDLGGVRADRLLDDLSSIAFVDVHTARTPRETRWSVAPAALVESHGGDVLCTGAWPEPLLAELRAIVDDEGGEWIEGSLAPCATPRIRGVDAATMFDYETTTADVEDAGLAAVRMVDRLPCISGLERELPRTETPTTGTWEVFSLRPMEWIPTSRPDAPGLYRRSVTYRREYLWRSEADLVDRTCAQVTPALGKHLLAQHQGRALVAYDAAERELRVPLGARLPGLYERAASLNSGRAPNLEEGKLAMVYVEVPRNFAERLTGRLCR